MSALLRTVGRLLFATILIASAYVIINSPQSQVAPIQGGLETIRGLHPALNFVPTYTELQKSLPGNLLVKAVGGFDALTGLLILLGFSLGGWLVVLRSIAIGAARFGPAVVAAVAKQNLAGLQVLLPELLPWAAILGFGLALAGGYHNRKRPAIK